ncbi:hypothetical protein [Bremerella sp.]|uniref:hypothetical protein n=1 Tax=Bremerella sp. TaxID=2795602 RepID=UPI00391BBAFD
MVDNEHLRGLIHTVAIENEMIAFAFQFIRYHANAKIRGADVLKQTSLSRRAFESGPLAMMIGGLIPGNHGQTLTMYDKKREHLDTFLELVDELPNMVLFVSIGWENL